MRLFVCFPSGVFDRSLDDKLFNFVVLSSIVVLCEASVGLVVKVGPFVEIRILLHTNSKSAFDWTHGYFST